MFESFFSRRNDCASRDTGDAAVFPCRQKRLNAPCILNSHFQHFAPAKNNSVWLFSSAQYCLTVLIFYLLQVGLEVI